MKARVRQGLLKPQYNVHDRYHDEGYAQAVARSSHFEHLVLAVISLNALWISVDVDYNHAHTIATTEWPFVVGDNLFCAFFSLELLIRFTAFQGKRDCLRDGWFVFDSLLLAMMMFETWIMLILEQILTTSA